MVSGYQNEGKSSEASPQNNPDKQTVSIHDLSASESQVLTTAEHGNFLLSTDILLGFCKKKKKKKIIEFERKPMIIKNTQFRTYIFSQNI